MKHIIYTILFALPLSLTGCMGGEDIGFDDDWSEPAFAEGQAPYGNNALTETNLITIAQLKARYLNGLQANDTVRIKDDIQIKGRVTGNDIGGNIYNEIGLQDASGAILVCISQGGLFSYLPVGQEILVNLKGLHIGYYGYQPQIGVAYTNSSGKTFPSRMSRIEWQTRFKLIGRPDPAKVVAEKFDLSRIKDTQYVKEASGKLMYVEGVKLQVKSGQSTWAPEAEGANSGNGVSRSIIVNGRANSSFVVRTSCYADFANAEMPTATVKLTGLFTVYTSNLEKYAPTWQILLRDESDVLTLPNQ